MMMKLFKPTTMILCLFQCGRVINDIGQSVVDDSTDAQHHRQLLHLSAWILRRLQHLWVYQPQRGRSQNPRLHKALLYQGRLRHSVVQQQTPADYCRQLPVLPVRLFRRLQHVWLYRNPKQLHNPLLYESDEGKADMQASAIETTTEAGVIETVTATTTG
jgi:hypothetical protein